MIAMSKQHIIRITIVLVVFAVTCSIGYNIHLSFEHANKTAITLVTAPTDATATFTNTARVGISVLCRRNIIFSRCCAASADLQSGLLRYSAGNRRLARKIVAEVKRLEDAYQKHLKNS